MPSLPVAVLHDPATLAGALGEHGACLLSDFPAPRVGQALHDALKQRQVAGTTENDEVEGVDGDGLGGHVSTRRLGRLGNRENTTEIP